VLRRLLDNPWTYFSLAGVLLVVLLMTQFEIRLPPRSKGTIHDLRALKDRKDLNVLFIVIDTLRADRLHAYGYARETSPTLDYLASTGVRFDRVISQSSWTKASMASMWTSVWPHRTGVLRWLHSLPPQVEMPAEILQKAGFRTAGIWRNGWVAPNFGFGQGFETYLKPQPGRTPEKFQRRSLSPKPLSGTDEDLTVAAREFLKDYANQRFFLYLHYMDVHQYAYDEESARFGTSYSDTYDNAIHWVDRNISSVIQELGDRKLWSKTLVVIVADHGEGFREHGLEGHAHTLYREVAEVPWIISLPFELQPGVVVTQTVANVDIWPTIFDLLGFPPESGVDGQSAVPLIEAAATNAPAPPERPHFAEIDRTWGRPKADPDAIVAVTLGPYRAIHPIAEKPDGDTPVPSVAKAAEAAKADDPDGADAPAAPAEKDRKIQLFDHRNDPWEKNDLAPGDAANLPPEIQDALRSYVATSTPPWGQGAAEVQLQEMELNQLRALGYVIK